MQKNRRPGQGRQKGNSKGNRRAALLAVRRLPFCKIKDIMGQVRSPCYKARATLPAFKHLAQTFTRFVAPFTADFTD